MDRILNKERFQAKNQRRKDGKAGLGKYDRQAVAARAMRRIGFHPNGGVPTSGAFGHAPTKVYPEYSFGTTGYKGGG